MASLESGNQLDHYQIEGLAAQSGMASIYHATDLKNGRGVAIKIPHLEVECDPVFFDRFKREEEIGQKLDHPGVMKVFRNEGRSRVYMVMEWVDGCPLRHILNEEKKLTAERAVRITLGICEALEYIHSCGIVHRDLKPENVMVNSEDRIKLIDFGIAGTARGRRLTFGKLTRTMGTPDYVSPEQVQSKRCDARADIYSLGVMFYEMLTGEVPFPADNALIALNDRLVNHPVPPREIDPNVSLQLQEIIYRALERDPANRYPGAREFAHDLRNPGAVVVGERTELRDWKLRRRSQPSATWTYLIFAIPIIIVCLLLFVVAWRN